jgi:hypothetical protein
MDAQDAVASFIANASAVSYVIEMELCLHEAKRNSFRERRTDSTEHDANLAAKPHLHGNAQPGRSIGGDRSG